jgi:glycosyltransferase involved in cell wall biosynthesis
MSVRRTRLVHIITRLELGGAQQNTLYCVEHHDRERFEVALVAGEGGMLDSEASRISNADVRLVPWLRHPIAPLADVRAVFRLASWLRSHRIDVVHTHSSKAGIVGRLAARLAGVPVVIHTVHGWSFNDTQSKVVRAAFVRLERLAARWSHRLVVVSSRNRDTGLAHGIGAPELYRTVHSGISIDQFRRPRGVRNAMRASLGYGEHDVVVGCVGNLKPQKGPLDFVEAAAAALRLNRRLRFVVVGDGPLREDVERRVEELGLREHFRLLGWRRDVGDLLQALDVFLLTSRFEGLPRSVLQAMAAGVPVVATEVDGTPEVVRHEETGLLIPPGAPDAAAAAVARLAHDPGLAERLRGQAAQELSEAFDIDRMVHDLERLYLEVARERGVDR